MPGTGVVRHARRVPPRVWVIVAASLLAAATFGFGALLIAEYPAMFWGDAYARVLTRDRLLVDRWLPLVQLIIYGVSRETKSIATLRLVHTAIAALAVFSSTLFAARRFTPGVGLLFSTLLVTNALFVSLSIDPYQEVAFLGLILFGLSLHERREKRWQTWLAVAAFNLACLTRYEGWFLVIVLSVEETYFQNKRGGFASGIRSGLKVGFRYGSSALVWLLVVALFGRQGSLWHEKPGLPGLAHRAVAYLYRCIWELASCPPRQLGWRWLAGVLVPLSAVA